MRKQALILKVVSILFTASCALTVWAADAPPVKMGDGVMTDAHGMTLYVFDRDMPGTGKSACNGPCAASWQPLKAQENERAEGDFSIINRDDGSKQWAYKGKPLYLWSKDQKPGDKTGDGINNVWHVAAP